MEKVKREFELETTENQRRGIFYHFFLSLISLSCFRSVLLLVVVCFRRLFRIYMRAD